MSTSTSTTDSSLDSSNAYTFQPPRTARSRKPKTPQSRRPSAWNNITPNLRNTKSPPRLEKLFLDSPKKRKPSRTPSKVTSKASATPKRSSTPALKTGLSTTPIGKAKSSRKIAFEFDQLPSIERFKKAEQALRLKERAQAAKYGLQRSIGGNDEDRKRVRDHNLEVLRKASINRPSKRQQLSQIVPGIPIEKQDDEIDLEKRNPVPIQYSYPDHHEFDRDDKFFIAKFDELNEMIMDFAQDNFNYRGIAEHILEHGPDVWKQLPESKDFVFWASLVAEADPACGGWNALLTNNESRTCLVAGIISRVIREKIFNELLFGARKDQTDHMESLEKTLLVNDAYHRTNHRALTTRALLDGETLTPLFYPTIATLTAQTTLLLTPLTKFLRSLPHTLNNPPPSQTAAYQSLHSLLSNAAYLSLLIRLSPTIFYLLDTPPGTIYTSDLHENISPESWTLSKNTVLKTYDRSLAAYEARLAAAQARLRELIPAGKLHTAQGRQAKKEFARAKLSKPLRPERTHRAQCKISCFPNVKRFKPGSYRDEDLPLYAKRGSREVEIIKAQITCYYAPLNKTGPGLQEFVGGKPWYKRDAFWNAGMVIVNGGVLVLSVGLAAMSASVLLPRVGVDVSMGPLGGVPLGREGVAEVMRFVERAGARVSEAWERAVRKRG